MSKLFTEIRKRSCLVCGRLPSEVAHVKTRGSGGINHPANLMPLCRKCHATQHQVGIITFIEQHESVKSYLVSHGWMFTDLNGKTQMFHVEVSRAGN